jgi:hypothetical protein
MANLTRAELADYQAAHALTEADRHPSRRAKPVAGAVALPRFLDLRPFPGRTRTERVAGWLLANVPRAQSWSPETLNDFASRIASTTAVVE